MNNIFNMFLAFLTYPFCKKQDVWLIGGNAGKLYVDNARAMHEYLLSKDVNVYFVVDKESHLKEYFEKKNIKYLIKGSYKAYLYFMMSKVSLFSHSISADIAPYLCAVPIISYFHNKNYKVFLNHGTVGLKKRIYMNEKYKNIVDKMLKSYNLNPCDSEFEMDIKVNDWKMGKDTMYVCGYPRYDRLINESSDKVSDILYMPTWRSYDSDLSDKIVELINHQRLNEHLSKNNIKLKLYIHQLAYDKVKLNIKNDNIIILDKSVDVTRELIDSKLLITDYSSVAYDFYFMNKKVYFYQFDKEKYLKNVGSYVNLDKFISKSYTKLDDLIDAVINEEDMNDFTYFKYKDNKNCERLYNKILEEVYNGKG